MEKEENTSSFVDGLKGPFIGHVPSVDRYSLFKLNLLMRNE